jgi:hypothetical protein
MKKYFGKYNCTPDPYNLEQNQILLVNDLKNSTLNSQKFGAIDVKRCILECKHQYDEEYYEVIPSEIIGRNKNNKQNSSRIEAKNLPYFKYKFETKYSLFIYI